MSWRDLIERAPASGRVLLVDDDPEIRRAVSRLLMHSGYGCQVAASAEEADLRLSEERYDVCLLDIELPRMSGLEFLGWSLKRDPEMAVIMLTGLDAPEVALECLDHGARTFLVKPMEAPFLVRAVRDAVALRRLLVEHNDRDGRPDPAGGPQWRA
ncbi:MAG TPA: response regulator [Longimicrobiales bacterium]|nr:response regulator [Longimicrobiales bacterium]